jgi:nicotinamidase-related amidase
MNKLLILNLYILILPVMTMAQPKSGAVKTALLIVDIQQFYFPGDGPGLYRAEEASLAAKEVLQLFRADRQLVIHVRHRAAKGFDIHPNVAPIDGEKVITKTEVNSFLRTDLEEYLKANSITRLVIIGMQTHMCLEAATRAAHDLGYDCWVVQDACATKDLKFGEKTVKAEEVQSAVFATLTAGRYARIINLEEFRKRKDVYLFQKQD